MYYFYRLYGLIFKSDIEFRQLMEVENTSNYDAEILLNCVPEDIREEVYRNKRDWGYNKSIIWFANMCGIFAVSEGVKICVEPYDMSRIEEANSFILGYCVAKLFWQRDRIAVHCSSVVIEDKALLISGQSGAGKSTLTQSFLKEGAEFLCDDMAVLSIEQQGIYVQPAFPQQKLCRDAAERQKYDLTKLYYIDEGKDKFAVDRRENFSSEQKKITGICVLQIDKKEKVSIEQVKGYEKLQILLSNLFLAPMFKKTGISPEYMYQCMKVVEKTPIYLIKRPSTGDSTKEQMALIKSSL